VGLVDDINAAVTSVVCSDWDIRKGTVVPTTEDVKLSNGAVGFVHVQQHRLSMSFSSSW
jgi:hypothetical protein